MEILIFGFFGLMGLTVVVLKGCNEETLDGLDKAEKSLKQSIEHLESIYPEAKKLRK